MNNKYLMSRNQNVKFVKDHLDEYLEDCLLLSKYEEDDPQRETALRNFKEAFEFILNNKDVENDYQCLLKLHTILMKDLNDNIENELTQAQIEELSAMINQYTKANTEVAIDVLMYLLDKRLFTDGDVRVGLAFANKVLIDNGNGFIVIKPSDREKFREKVHAFKNNEENDLKDWLYKYCVKGIKNEY